MKRGAALSRPDMRAVPIAALAIVAITMLSGCLAPIEERFRASEVEAPRWSVGDWWSYTLASDVYEVQGNITVVVTNVTDDGYILGAPADEDATVALLQHLPALGPVRNDLSYDVHETRFDPIRFPLEDGLTWETTWITADVRFAARLENGTWNITNDGHHEDAGAWYNLTYDPAVGAFTRFARVGLDGRVRIAAEMFASGTNLTGDFRAPGNIRVALLESRTSGSVSGGMPTAPNPTFTAPEGAQTLLVGCLAGGAPGQYHAEVRSPTGVICQLDATFQPGEDVVRAQIVEAPAEEGAWEARLLAVGQGSATAEVLAYTAQTVTLPSR